MKRIAPEALEALMAELDISEWGAVYLDDAHRARMRAARGVWAENSILNAPMGSEQMVFAIAVPYSIRGLVESEAPKEGVTGISAVVDAFAWEFDYHREVGKILERLMSGIECSAGTGFEAGAVRSCVDTSPYADQEIGWLAGLGRLGKNHLLLNDRIGTHFFIGYVVIEGHGSLLPEGMTFAGSGAFDAQALHHTRCATCELCVRACPTGACGYGRSMETCLSALTQSTEVIPDDLARRFGNRLYGCSICQEICPANANPLQHPLLVQHTVNLVDVCDVLDLGSRAFKRRYGHMGFAWKSPWIYKRNALIVLGNVGRQQVERALDILEERPALREDPRLQGAYDRALNRLRSLKRPVPGKGICGEDET